jgi:hypothetical protein
MADIDAIIKQIERLGKTTVLVGIPAEKNQRKTDTRINNAALGYIQETGSPAAHIPPRPFLRPGVDSSRNEWLPKLEAAGRAASNGENFDRLLREAGELAVRAVKRRIQAGIPPPLSPETVRRRRRRTPGSKYRRKALTPADVTPLIDTGSLINSITTVIRRR